MRGAFYGVKKKSLQMRGEYEFKGGVQGEYSGRMVLRLVDVRRDLQRVIEESRGILCEVDGLDEKLRSGKTVLGLEYTLRNADGTVPRLPGNCSLRIWIFGHKTLPWD